ncbi:MAG TPA: FAD-dependent oxidoreductase [Solirubrobacteraceae bacterium]|nr:FAD-dependent oxidoreductase [Solirubrobacteraceae bacterium]
MTTAPRRTQLADRLRAAEPRPFWLANPARPAPPPRPPAQGHSEVDLLVVGGGLTGLWTALQALEQEPDTSVMVLEGSRIAEGASGRNGGFLSASLTHGIANGLSRWPAEMDTLESFGRANFQEIRSAVGRYGIDCGWAETGEIDVAAAAYQVAELEEDAAAARRFGWDAVVLDRESLRAEVNSPTYHGGLWHRDGVALVDPARLSWGLASAIEGLGGQLHEQANVTDLSAEGAGVRVRTDQAEIRARRIVLATSAFPPLLRRIRHYVIPVYDYVLVSEPIPADRLAAIGWTHRQGISDLGNRFHYYRLTEDNRLLWGGYDAIYYFGGATGAAREQRPQTHNLLLEHLLETFPSLEGIGFTHRWGGAIDTCSRFCVTFGTALAGRVAYAVGFTGLGVGASRFGAAVALDLVHGRDTERTRLRMVRERPIPFPPEPARYLAVQATRTALARADAHAGRRGPWLRLLDRIGAGFDS